jgi:FkbM family methyltransferase
MSTGSKRAKAAIKRLFWTVGWDLRKLQYANTDDEALRRLILHARPAVILDVGANIGQFAQKVRDVGYAGTIVSFEAVPQVHARLQERARRDNRWRVAPCAALGRQRGTVEMNIAANTESSSVLAMKTLHLEAAPESRYVETQSVRLERLDVLARECVPSDGDLFLKIDTQGYEREVLQGASDLLSRVKALQMELSLAPLYESAPSFIEMIDYLASLGLEVFDMVPSFRDPRTGRVLQMDGFFVRTQ